MTMSSLQQRVHNHASLSATDDKKKVPPQNNNNNHTFETCFSAGLDLTEFTNGRQQDARTYVAASADLAQRKINDAARRHEEMKEEAALEQRVADMVATTTKQSASTRFTKDDQTDSTAPRALHPDNIHDKAGNRDDNFVQFQGAASLGNDGSGFLSSLLVSNHKSEEECGRTISHKSRTALLRNKSQSKKGRKKFNTTVVSRGQQAESRSQKHNPRKTSNSGSGAGRKVAAMKKSSRSKY